MLRGAYNSQGITVRKARKISIISETWLDQFSQIAILNARSGHPVKMLGAIYSCRSRAFKAMFTRDRSQMDPTLSWNGPFLFTRYRSAYQRLFTRDRSVIVRY